MDFRSILRFILLSFVILFLWKRFVIDNIAPPAPAPVVEEDDDDTDKKPKAKRDEPAVAEKPKPELANNPHQDNITIGSLDPEGEYFFQATLTTTGAAVQKLQLSDTRYHSLENLEEPLELVGTLESGKQTFRTFSSTFTGDDKLKELLEDHPLDEEDWKIVEQSESSVTFEFTIPGQFRVRKRFTVPAVDREKEGLSNRQVRDRNASGYQLHLQVEIENLDTQEREVQYVLQGPVKFPIENPDTARKLQDIKYGYIDDGELTNSQIDVESLIEQTDENTRERWTKPFRYVGVDGQFFAALVLPQEKKRSSDYVEYYEAEVLETNEENEKLSHISVKFASDEFELEPGESTTQDWYLFAGPKRQKLLDAIDAGAIVEYGWFAPVSKAMLWLLNFLHETLYLPYALAIICLTILVRGALFPISRKQAISAARMKELQPKLAELKKKYGDDKEKFLKAQMELFRDAGYNPLAGCLPMLLQLPIFIGLYYGLYTAIDLRASEFLWIQNLAAPDNLFTMPFKVPLLGTSFNLLPIITIVLFIAQQKMFMPTPDPEDEQAVWNARIMNFMMVFMGFLFYHVPAGLCLYFIASSLWGMGERKLLDVHKNPATADGGNSGSGGSGGSSGWKPSGGGSNGSTKRNNSNKNQKSKSRGRSKNRR
ncbi:membrane protein insertase YidC [Thalassoroseus pseudoceratinae]|uniref:membrane protein insertase YidC n=1 Tax=Thalassoroseus pseudoceratinae TaxID=2713176 RepID=UPI0014203B4F|nr:membrane protein insertase YidC [Thalassoroseus pseudoceratinae]